ncbi:nuclear transport factor 2 family protein [Rhodopirellula sp. JC740]|uniref:Nuclear transport factor 2 family protein n=1 Tax=Rhodopirellula halodulae TaxID=2894198 RepID=A0ABS8NLE8_9BACT|nr:nuclear transport factor 2 family protein [Rhodopirellula sp. JC740]MCC9644340.1 nuclear transport factor 2 family protein [Rhodopirellula sp. JC740]
MFNSEEYSEPNPEYSKHEEVFAALLRRWLKLGWERNDNALVEEHFHPECIVSGLGPDVVEGIDELIATHRAICGRMLHRTARLQSLLLRHNQFAATLEFEGKHRDSGTDVAFEVASFGVMRDGLIYRAHNIVDYTGLYAKLGLLDTAKMAEHFG